MKIIEPIKYTKTFPTSLSARTAARLATMALTVAILMCMLIFPAAVFAEETAPDPEPAPNPEPAAIVLESKNITLEYKTTTYDGKAKKPQIIADNMVEGEDYTVIYENNIMPGYAAAVITGAGGYEGTVTKTFRIKPAATAKVKANLYGYDDVQVTWKKVTGATGYKLEYKKLGISKYKVLNLDSATLNVKLPDLADGTKYKIKVTAMVSCENGKTLKSESCSAEVWTLKKIAKPKVYGYSRGKALVQWKNIEGESGYQISRARESSGTAIAETVKSNTKNQKAVKIPRDEKRYFKVRAYKNVNGKKIYGPWSAAVSYIDLDVVDSSDEKYDYKNMQNDIKALVKKFPDRLSYSSLGTTADNREIYCLVLGNPDAPKQILVQASIHAREWINTQVTMERLEYYCEHYYTGKCKDVKYSNLFDKVAVYIVPMVNPDGVSISQYGYEGIKNSKLRSKAKKMKLVENTTRKWKANARGVDINRNFPDEFHRKTDEKKPASERYCGKKPLSEAESKAIADISNSLPNLKACLNYHTMGKAIYWGSEQKGKKRSGEIKLKNLIKDLTGYYLINESKTYGYGGDLERYYMRTLNVPYVCIETTKQTPPGNHKAFWGAYNDLKYTMERTALLYY